MTALAARPLDPYAPISTASMLVAPAASLLPRGYAAAALSSPTPDRSAAASFSPAGLRTITGACSGSDLEWVPDTEQAVVPEGMRQMCGQCPARRDCLRLALETGSVGYWAGTTCADRAQLAGADLAAAELLQAAARLHAVRAAARDLADAMHPTGQGSLRWYRRAGCRCTECRRSNSNARAAERARARLTRQSRVAAA